jgi:hypothetical protein
MERAAGVDLKPPTAAVGDKLSWLIIMVTMPTE